MDTFGAEEMARRAVLILARRGKPAIVGPSVPFGPVAGLKFPGIIGVRSSTLIQLLTDLCRGLHANGVKHIVFVLGHDESFAASMTVAFDLVEETRFDLNVVVANWLPFLRTMKLELFAEKRIIPEGKDDGHGGAQEAAQLLWQYPNLVVRERLKDDYVQDMPRTPAPFAGPVALGGGVYAPRRAAHPDPRYPGYVGYPSAATPELGDQLYEAIGTWLADVVHHYC